MYLALHKKIPGFFIIILGILLFGMLTPPVAFAQSGGLTLEITGDGVANPVTLNIAELEDMEQYEHVYSTINTYPTKKWYTARGVKLKELLNLANIKKEEAQLIRFVSSDGYEVTLTAKELLEDRRYYFPGLKENHPHDGCIPGSAEDKEEVEPIIALYSVEGSNEPAHMTDRDVPHLIIGQRAVTEQACTLFLKHVSKIEVLTTAPEKWDAPRAKIPDGTVVPKGTMLELFNKLGDADKIHYTIDGSTPTVDSPMINWVAKRWHSLRPEDLGIINSPFEINKDVVIKAKTIGPGKEDSDVVTFTFTVDHTGEVPDPTKVPGGPSSGIVLDRDRLDLEVGGAFRLEATVVPYNATNVQVTWSSDNTGAAAVDSNGLVTVVGEGTAIITATTVDGNHKAYCMVNGPGLDEIQVIDPEVIGSIEGEGQKVLNEPEVGQQYLTEEKEQAVIPGTTDKDDEESETPGTLSGGGISGDEPLPAIGELRHLAKKEDIKDYMPDVIDNNASPESSDNQLGQGSGVSDGQHGRVFEMFFGTGPIPLLVEQDKLHVHMLITFLILFISGAGRRYLKYAKEYEAKWLKLF